MAEFAEGDLAILQHATYFEEWNGSLALVVGGLMRRKPRNLQTLDCEFVLAYRVRPLVRDGQVVNCEPHQLRRLDQQSPALR